jgi:hypothetical protein
MSAYPAGATAQVHGPRRLVKEDSVTKTNLLADVEPIHKS